MKYLLGIIDLNKWKWVTNTSAVKGLIYKKLWLAYFLITLYTFQNRLFLAVQSGRKLYSHLNISVIHPQSLTRHGVMRHGKKNRHYLVPHWSRRRPTTINTINLCSNVGWCASAATNPSRDSSNYRWVCWRCFLTIH